ncbi:hypothetical protein ACTXT7_011038, partial [Hymenolepis weldensis]
AHRFPERSDPSGASVNNSYLAVIKKNSMKRECGDHVKTLQNWYVSISMEERNCIKIWEGKLLHEKINFS